MRVYIAPGSSSIGVGDMDIFNKMATENIAKHMMQGSLIAEGTSSAARAGGKHYAVDGHAIALSQGLVV